SVALAQLSLAGAVGMHTPCGLARAACRPALEMAVPLLAELPTGLVHPPLVWMPIARPLDSMFTAEPELPPSVSTWYCNVVLKNEVNGPVPVCCTWFGVAGVGSMPKPVMRSVWLVAAGTDVARV